MSVPLEPDTARLQLRQFVHADWPAMHRLCGNAEATRFTFRRAMASLAGHWALAVEATLELKHKFCGSLWHPYRHAAPWWTGDEG